MTDLANLTKSQINALLATPLTASALKKTSKTDLVAMFDAMPASDALDADIRDAREDDTPPTDTPPNFDADPTTDDPTPVRAPAPKLTAMEKRVLVAYLEAGIDCNGAETLDAMLADNMTWSDTAEIATRTGLTAKQVQGVQSSLSSKGLLVITDEVVNGEGPVQQVLADDGVRRAFDLLADGVEAKAPAKAAPAARKPRTLAPHVYCQPADEPRALKRGSKKHLLAEALLNGATMDELTAATGWNRATVQSGFTNDMKMSGFGVRRDDAGKYWLILPAGVKHLPITDADVSRAAAVAGCR